MEDTRRISIDISIREANEFKSMLALENRSIQEKIVYWIRRYLRRELL